MIARAAFLAMCACCCLSPLPATAQQNRIPPSPEVLPYFGARSVVDYSQSELTGMYPELKGLVSVTTQDGLEPILQKVGKNVEALFGNLRNTTALENVQFEREEPGGTSDAYLRRQYYYIITPATGPDELGFEEYRTNLKNELFNPAELKGTYLITSGHAAAPIFFHPKQRPGCHFRYLGTEKSGRKAHAVGFAQDPGLSPPRGHINLVGTEIAIMVQGIAWVDPETYEILRMRLDLLTPRKDAGLDQHTTSIEFSEVSFGTESGPLWLPREVRIVIACRGWKFQNRHTYSQYRLFTVQSREGDKKIIRPPE